MLQVRYYFLQSEINVLTYLSSDTCTMLAVIPGYGGQSRSQRRGFQRYIQIRSYSDAVNNILIYSWLEHFDGVPDLAPLLVPGVSGLVRVLYRTSACCQPRQFAFRPSQPPSAEPEPHQPRPPIPRSPPPPDLAPGHPLPRPDQAHHRAPRDLVTVHRHQKVTTRFQF